MSEKRFRVVRVFPDPAEAALFLQAADGLPDISVTEIARGPGEKAGQQAGAAYGDYAQELSDGFDSEELWTPDAGEFEAYAAKVVRDGGALLELARHDGSPADLTPLFESVERLRLAASSQNPEQR